MCSLFRSFAMEVQSKSNNHQFHLKYFEDLLEDCRIRKLDIEKRLDDNNSSKKKAEKRSEDRSSTTKFSDILSLILDNSSVAVPVPAWKEHLMQVYVRGAVDSYFAGNKKGTPSSSPSKVKPKLPMEVIQKKRTPREIVKPSQKTRILRGKVEKFEPLVGEKKIKNDIATRKVPNSTSEINNKKSAPAKKRSQPVQLNKKTQAKGQTQLKEKKIKVEHVKSSIDEEAKVDILWREILSRNNLNVQQRIHYLDLEQKQDQTQEIRSISPLIPPDVSISPRKFQQQEQQHLSSPITNFKIDKFLGKIRQTEAPFVSPPTPSEAASSSYTFSIGSRFSSSSGDEIDNRLQKIKKSLLDLESPTPLSSSNSTICRILDDCFDSYEPGRDKKVVNNQMGSCCVSCSKSWSTPVEERTCCSNISGISPIDTINQNCQSVELSLSQWNYPPRITHKSENTKELQRSILEADPKFKRVIDNIRRESEEVLRRTSQCEEHYRDPFINHSDLHYSWDNQIHPKDTYYRPSHSLPLSTDMSELSLGSDFTDVNSDILICPSTSNWDSM